MKTEHWLVEHSREINANLNVHFLENPIGNALLNDIEHFPHAFVLACFMDRQISAERAWSVPYRIQKSVNALSKEFTIAELYSIPLEWYENTFKEQSLHRHPKDMANVFYQAVRRLQKQYNGDASQIWADCPSSATVVYRFLEFEGVGRKIATMAANILYRQYKIPFSDCWSIDVSPDVHVIRIFERTGIVRKRASKDEIIYRARDLNPEYPGIMDAACWRIGRDFCHPQNPNCIECPVGKNCPKLIH